MYIRVLSRLTFVTCGKSPCHWANTGRVYEKVDFGVRVWSRPAGERFAWPACRPDLNPIGQLWDQLGRAVRTRVTIATLGRISVRLWYM